MTLAESLAAVFFQTLTDVTARADLDESQKSWTRNMLRETRIKVRECLTDGTETALPDALKLLNEMSLHDFLEPRRQEAAGLIEAAINANSH